MTIRNLLITFLGITAFLLFSSCQQPGIPPTETTTAELSPGQNTVRFPVSNLVVQINYLVRSGEYAVQIPRVSRLVKTVSATDRSSQVQYDTKQGKLTLTINNKPSNAEGRQKNRRVEMTVVFE